MIRRIIAACVAIALVTIPTMSGNAAQKTVVSPTVAKAIEEVETTEASSKEEASKSTSTTTAQKKESTKATTVTTTTTAATVIKTTTRTTFTTTVTTVTTVSGKSTQTTTTRKTEPAVTTTAYPLPKVGECVAFKYGGVIYDRNTGRVYDVGREDKFYIVAEDNSNRIYDSTKYHSYLIYYPAITDAVLSVTALPIDEFEVYDDYPSYILGDLTGDARVSVFDLILLRERAANGTYKFAAERVTADLNMDGAINMSDLVCMSHFLHGQTDDFS